MTLSDRFAAIFDYKNVCIWFLAFNCSPSKNGQCSWRTFFYDGNVLVIIQQQFLLGFPGIDLSSSKDFGLTTCHSWAVDSSRSGSGKQLLNIHIDIKIYFAHMNTFSPLWLISGVFEWERNIWEQHLSCLIFKITTGYLIEFSGPDFEIQNLAIKMFKSIVELHNWFMNSIGC